VHANTYDFYRLLGDMDGSGTVNTTDFTTFISTFLRAPTDPFYLGAADFDGSGTIDSTDFTQFVGNFLKSVPSPLPN
jgi:Ca2+-binding EF-hand superfamily protein